MSGGRLLAVQARLLSAVPNNKTREIRNLKVFAYKVTRDIGFKTFIALSFSLKPSSKFLISFVKIWYQVPQECFAEYAINGVKFWKSRYWRLYLVLSSYKALHPAGEDFPGLYGTIQSNRVSLSFPLFHFLSLLLYNSEFFSPQIITSV